MAGNELHKGLRQRHLAMIAIGGVIGGGLFLGSGAIIGAAGPGAFLTYALTGALIVLVMRMLGEMATAHPTTGSFSDYAREALGDWAGFSIGWLYWYFWVGVVGFEAVAGAKIIQEWIPGMPIWLSGLLLMIAMTATNLFSVRGYGEFEYWFAMIKIVAIVAFLALGLAYVSGLFGGSGTHFSNLTDHGGFFPKGGGAILGGVVTVIFSMVGAEIATIAAAESDDPEKAITRAVNSVVLRVITFYVGATFLLACILPWNDENLSASPFVAALNVMNIPGAADVMRAVVLVAVMSCLNSGMYTGSRMLFVLAKNREAPSWMVTVDEKGTPRNAILFSSIVGFVCVLCGYFWPDKVFIYILNSAGAVMVFVYLLVAISQFILRRRHGSQHLPVKMWLFPWLTFVAIAGMIGVLYQMLVTSADTRTQLLLSCLAWAVFLVIFVIMRAVRKDPPASAVAGPPDRVLAGTDEGSH